LRREKTRKKKWTYTLIALTLAAILAGAIIYVNLSNTLTAALIKASSTFRRFSVTYPSVEPNSVDINITFILNNPTDFAVTVESIFVSFSIDNNDIGEVVVFPSQNIPAGEHSFFYFIRHVTNENVLKSLRNQTYGLKVTGKLGLSANYFFIQSRWDRNIAFFETATGIS
jgi:hypothetical protein